MNKKYILISLIIILTLGTFLRFYTIGSESLWLDEGATALAIKYHGPLETLKIFYTIGQILPEFYFNNPDLPTKANADLPVYYFLLAIWAKLFGISVVALRAFSAAAGSLSILLIFFVAKELFNPKVALLSSFIASLNLTLIEYSQEARNYSFFIFISLLSIYFLIKFLKTDKNIFLTGYIISNIVGIYTHYLFAFFVVFQALFIYGDDIIYLIKNNKFRLRKLSAFFLIIIVSYLPLIPRILNQKLVSSVFFGKPTLSSIIEVIFRFNGWLYPSEGLRISIYSKNFLSLSLYDSTLILSIILLAVISIFFAAWALFALLKSKKKNGILVVLWLIAPFLASLIATYLHPTVSTFGPIIYIIYILPAYFILVSYGVLSMKWKYTKFVIILFVLLSILPISAYYSNPHKQQFRDVALFLKDNAKKDDVIFFNIRTGITPFTYYYGESDQNYPLNNLSRSIELSQNKKSIWLVSSFTKYSDPQGNIKRYFDENYDLVEKKDFFDIDLLHYVKKS